MSRPSKNQKQQTDSPFKRLRLNIKLSQEELARDIGVAVSTIRRWEKGKAEPTMTIAQMKRFCLVVERELHELPNSLLPFVDSKSTTYEVRVSELMGNRKSELNQKAS